MVFSLDAKKPFKSIKYHYLLSVLERIGFGPNLIHGIEISYWIKMTFSYIIFRAVYGWSQIRRKTTLLHWDRSGQCSHSMSWLFCSLIKIMKMTPKSQFYFIFIFLPIRCLVQFSKAFESRTNSNWSSGQASNHYLVNKQHYIEQYPGLFFMWNFYHRWKCCTWLDGKLWG